MEKFKFKKKYGQNFLQNDSILEDIVNSLDNIKELKIVEIGPGAGALTKKLIKLGNKVIAFEIDTDLKSELDKLMCDNLKVVYHDFLDIKLDDYFNREDKISVVANIPYYITTPIITKFIDENFIPEEMILMVQKEVALRLSSKPKNSDYGAITVLLNYFFDIQYLFTVDRTEFYPVPNVDSAIIKLRKKENTLKCDYEKFKKLVHDSFKQKRKNLKNNLKEYDLIKIQDILEKYGYSLNNRAEDISYEIFVELVNIL